MPVLVTKNVVPAFCVCEGCDASSATAAVATLARKTALKIADIELLPVCFLMVDFGVSRHPDQHTCPGIIPVPRNGSLKRARTKKRRGKTAALRIQPVAVVRSAGS